MSRARLLAEMDSAEIADWMAYFIYSEKRADERKEEEKQIKLREKFKAIMGGKMTKKKKSKESDKK